MSKEVTLTIVGVLVLVTPFLGLPMSWLSVLLPAFGAVVLIIAQLIRRDTTAPRTLHLEDAMPPRDFEPRAVSYRISTAIETLIHWLF